ncbi:MAG: MerR family transcriptional regulator [Paracoccaceae bacterium]
MDKSPEAFRTISEVAESLETPAHVLRFWESRFPQIRPVKRAGGRRYYRPADVALLSGIKHLLHNEGMTIRGVQKILREQGVRHVAAMAGAVDADFDPEALDLDVVTLPEAETTRVVALESGVRRSLAEPVDPDAVLMNAEVHELRATVIEPTQPVWADAIKPVVAKPIVAKPVAQPAEPVPEAPHIWVDAEPELELTAPVKLHTGAGSPVPVKGLAARLRALPRPVSASVTAEFAALRGRLGVLHGQMADALRSRR